MTNRASRITKAHVEAALGKMAYPAGVSQDETDTIMPIPLNKNGKVEQEDKGRFEPVTILYKK